LTEDWGSILWTYRPSDKQSRFLEKKVKASFLKMLEKGSLLWGSWPVRFFAWWIATGYFLFYSARRQSSVRLYQGIFPNRRAWYYPYCAWRQFHSFAATFGDRVDMGRKKEGPVSTQGSEGILEAAQSGRGGIILMSHLGCFEIAARGFQEFGLKHLMIMGEKEAKQVARDQRENLKARGITILVATGQDDSLSDGLEAIQFIREGGIVSVAGDLVWTRQRSSLPVRFFDQEVALPSGPHLLALVSGAPLFLLFTFRNKRGRHQVIISPPQEVKCLSRSERKMALQASAQRYATALEAMVRQRPFQWYIFEPFFQARPIQREKGPGRP
jgi:predicted LPLAT superfamily acyltransferase